MGRLRQDLGIWLSDIPGFNVIRSAPEYQYNLLIPIVVPITNVMNSILSPVQHAFASMIIKEKVNMGRVSDPSCMPDSCSKCWALFVCSPLSNWQTITSSNCFLDLLRVKLSKLYCRLPVSITLTLTHFCFLQVSSNMRVAFCFLVRQIKRSQCSNNMDLK